MISQTETKKKYTIEKNYEWYADMVENINDMVQCVDPEGHFLFVNNAWRQALGYSEDEIEKLSVFDIIHADYKEHCVLAFNKVLSGVDIGQVEVVFISKSGNKVIVEGSVNCKFEDGKPAYTRGIFRDNTGRKKNENETKKIQVMDELILNSAGEGILGLDTEGKHTFVNLSALKMFGFSKDELIGFRSHSMWHHTKMNGDPFPAEECPIYGAYKEGKVHRGRDIFWKKDGSSFWVEYTSTPLKIEERVTGAVVVFNDVSNQITMEEKLRVEKDKAMTYFNFSGVIMLVIDVSGKVVLINKKGCNILGYDSPEEIIGKNWIDNFIPLDNREKISKIFQKIISGNKESFEYYENLVLRKDGSERIVAWHNTLLWDKQGKIFSSLSSGEDITEKKKTIEELEKRAFKLEKFNQFTIGREIKMIELKKEIDELKKQIANSK